MTKTADSRRYPRLAEYIRLLPDGLDSYPDCKAKGTLITSALQGHDTSDLGEGLPDSIVEMLRSPPHPAFWVPGTMSDAIFYTIVDSFYPDEEAVLEWTRRRTLKTADSRMYRALSRVTGPAAIVRMAAAVHGLFQKGTNLSVEGGRGDMAFELTHPPFLHGGLNHKVNCAMFEVLLDRAGAPDPVVEMTESAPTKATYHARWVTRWSQRSSETE